MWTVQNIGIQEQFQTYVPCTDDWYNVKYDGEEQILSKVDIDKVMWNLRSVC